MNKLFKNFCSFTRFLVDAILPIYRNFLGFGGDFGKVMLNILVGATIVFMVGMNYVVALHYLDNVAGTNDLRFWLGIPALIVVNYMLGIKAYAALLALKEDER